jgi:Zn-dependent protease
VNGLADFLTQISIWAVPTVFAIIVHEVMHGVVARIFGDDTAARAGRLTLNPVSHIDPFGTVILPALLLLMHLPVFGYARPVPVDFRRLRHARLGMIAVAAAGPLTNFSLAILSAIVLRALAPAIAAGDYHPIALPLFLMMRASVVINIVLGVFNFFPLLPLDGGRVLAGLLPEGARRTFSRLEPYGFLILLLLLYTNYVGMVINPIIDSITRVLL